MKIAMPRASCWALLLGLLALPLIEQQPVAAQTFPDGITTTTLAPSVAPTTPPTAASAGATVPPPPSTTEEEDEVVVDVLVAGASQEQVEAIAALLKYLQMSNKLTVNHEKVNGTVEWDHGHGHEEDKEEDRRFLRASKGVIAAKEGEAAEEEEDINPALNRTRCSLILNGGNYSVVHITLQGKASKVRYVVDVGCHDRLI